MQPGVPAAPEPRPARPHSHSPSTAASTDHRERQRSGTAFTAPAPAGAAIVFCCSPDAAYQRPRAVRSAPGRDSEHLATAAPRGTSAPRPRSRPRRRLQPLERARPAVRSLAGLVPLEGCYWLTPTVHHPLSSGEATPPRSHPGAHPGAGGRHPALPPPPPCALPAWLSACLSPPPHRLPVSPVRLLGSHPTDPSIVSPCRGSLPGYPASVRSRFL